MIACVLCGQSAAPFTGLLCESCNREHKRSIDRTVWFGGIREDMGKTLQTMNAFVEQFPDGAAGATLDDLRLMRREVSPRIQVKAAGGVRTLDALLDVMDVGVTRVGATATQQILDDFQVRFGHMTRL